MTELQVVHPARIAVGGEEADSADAAADRDGEVAKFQTAGTPRCQKVQAVIAA